MRRIIIITSFDQLREGMEVSFKHYCLSSYRDAIVTDAKYEQKCWMIDGKPVRALTLESVNLTCAEGEYITVKESNFKNFSIFAKIR